MEKHDENESLYETHIDLRDFISKKKLCGKNNESNEKSTVSFEELLQYPKLTSLAVDVSYHYLHSISHFSNIIC